MSVPDAVTAELGVDERTVPSPVNVTDETVPPPEAVVAVVYQLVRLDASNVVSLPAPSDTEAFVEPLSIEPPSWG